jgi:pyridoxal phosphate enzyme (YggS family)
VCGGEGQIGGAWAQAWVGETMSDTLKGRLARVRERMATAAARGGRTAEGLTLVAVSKRKPLAAIVEAYDAGQRDFGENYGQELLSKAEQLADREGIRWHYIGHLQTNKVKQLVGPRPAAGSGAGVALLHGVDRAKLIREIDKRAAAAEATVALLIQVNISGEDTKSGCHPDELGELLSAVDDAGHLRLSGLMTMPPPVADPELARGWFQQLRELRDRHGGAQRLPELSMGMSQDFEVAIEEGATMVRVGTAIFGARD